MVNTDLATDFIMIGDQILDVAISEEITLESEVTDYPVETGSTISDNIRLKPTKISITGIISNTPIGPVATKRGADEDPANTCWLYLHDLRLSKKPFTVYTSLDRFNDMVITQLTIPRDPGGADFLKFTCQMQQIDFVQNEITIPTIPTGKPPNNKTKPLVDATPRPIKVLQVDYGTNGWYWFDNQLQGWRTGAAVGRKGIWLAYRGRPYGVTDAAWAHNPKDSHWRTQIKTATTSRGVFATSTNPYDPFNNQNMLRVGHVYNAKDVRTVDARIVSADEFEKRLYDLAFGVETPSISRAWYDPEVD